MMRSSASTVARALTFWLALSLQMRTLASTKSRMMALHIAPDIADLGEFRRLDLDERRVHQLCQPTRDFRLAYAGRADHQNVLGDDLIPNLFRELSAAVSVAQGDGDRALGVVLTDDIAIQFRERSASGVKFRHAQASSTDYM